MLSGKSRQYKQITRFVISNVISNKRQYRYIAVKNEIVMWKSVNRGTELLKHSLIGEIVWNCVTLS